MKKVILYFLNRKIVQLMIISAIVIGIGEAVIPSITDGKRIDTLESEIIANISAFIENTKTLFEQSYESTDGEEMTLKETVAGESQIQDVLQNEALRKPEHFSIMPKTELDIKEILINAAISYLEWWEMLYDRYGMGIEPALENLENSYIRDESSSTECLLETYNMQPSVEEME